MARKLEVAIVGDASSLKKALGEAQGKVDGFGSALGGMAKAGVLAAGAAGIGGLFVTLKAGISEFTQSTKVAAQTAAVIKSTGGAANVTSKHVDALATSIMNYSGIDDEAIKSGENMLLTFKNIRNEAGKGNDIFDQSTKILTDMSVALGGDASKNAIRLGKALNDPVKGVTALTKVGVTFTDAQKKTIQSLVDSGHSMDAQRIILRELNSEFGGSAKAAGDTLPGQINKLKETFNNLAGDLVAKAVPAVSAFVGFIADKGVPALGQFFGAIGDAAGPAITKLGEAFTSAGPAIMSVINGIGGVIKNNVTPIFQALGQIAGTAIQKIGDVLRENGPQIHQIFENLGTVISNLGKVVIPILKVAFDTVLPIAIRVLIPVLTLVTDAIAKITTVTSTVIADTVALFAAAPIRIRNAFVGGWDAVKGAFGTAFDVVKKYAIDPIGDVVGFFRDLPGRIAGALEGAVKGAAKRVKDAIVSIFDGLPGFVKKALGIASPSKVFEGIGEAIIDGTVKGIKNKSSDLLSAGWDLFKRLMPQLTTPGPPPKDVQDWLNMMQQPLGTGGVGSGSASSGGLVNQVVQALSFARGHGWHGSVTSGFRTYAEQAALYDRYLHGGPLAARPGTSSHEFGQAVDVTDYGTFGRIMGMAPPGARLYNRLGAADPVHYSVSGYDKGGLLPTGLTLAYNATGKPETVLPFPPDDLIGGGPVVNVYVGTLAGSSVPELADTIRRELIRVGRRNGGSVGLG